MGIVILVVRSGGIAGLRRRWQVAPERDQQHWVALVESCPWDDPEPPARLDADRFTWSIRAVTSHDERHRELPESALTGPWRELVDAVRAASDEGRSSRPSRSGGGE
ncbi:MAG: protealysin inhibitor emfourin [Microbacterium sp.]